MRIGHGVGPFPSCAPIVDAAVPEAMVIHGAQGNFASLCNQEINFDPCQAVGVGPGLRVNISSYELLGRILKECPAPLVLDADALTQFASIPAGQHNCKAPLWLNPASRGNVTAIEVCYI